MVQGPAVGRVIADLGGQNISWVSTAYLLASTVAVPVYCKLSDIYGRRIFFLGGMVVFLKEIPLRQSVRPDMGEEALADPELDGQAIQAARHESAPLAADVTL